MTATAARHLGSGYSRITLVGDTRRADLVLPSFEPVGVLFTDMLSVLGEEYGPARLVLMTATGALVPPSSSLADAGVVDGAVLRLVAEQSAPPPPVVNDVTEETATDIGSRRGRWSQQTSHVFATCGAGLLTAALVIEILIATAPHPRTGGVALLIAGACVSVAALGLGWTRRTPVVVATAAVGAVLVAGGGVLIGTDGGWGARDRIAVVLGAGWLGLAVATAGRRRAGDLSGALLGVVLTGGWVALNHTPMTATQADAVVALVAALACGVLPRWALSTSGLASLDDSRLVGAPVRRERLRRSLRDAHLALIAATAVVTVMVTVCGLSLAATHRAWPVAAAGASALVVALRARALPLASEGAMMLASAAVVGIGLSVTWVRYAPSATWPLTVTVLAVLTLYSCVWVRPPAHVRARLRNLGDRLEAVAVIALIPLTVGVFGVFGALLHTFDK